MLFKSILNVVHRAADKLAVRICLTEMHCKHNF